MSDFKDVAHKTVAELFDMLKEKVAEIKKLKSENDELQNRIDYASQEVKGLERFTGEDCIADFEVLQGAVSHACKRVEKALRGEHDL